MSQLHWRLHDAEIYYKKDKQKQNSPIYITTFYGYSCLHHSISKNHTKNTAEKNSTFSHELNYKKPAISNG